MAKDRKKIYRKRKSKRVKKKPSRICELCFGEGFTVFVVGERAIVLPCDCYDPKIKLEKTLH